MKKVLVVDDDKDILDAIQVVLETSGYNTDVTTEGDEIYQKITEYQPDLIILDVLLSGNDGRVICRKLKQDKKTVPIIMISAHPSARDSIKACGADSFVAKPFAVAELLSEIERFIG